MSGRRARSVEPRVNVQSAASNLTDRAHVSVWPPKKTAMEASGPHGYPRVPLPKPKFVVKAERVSQGRRARLPRERPGVACSHGPNLDCRCSGTPGAGLRRCARCSKLRVARCAHPVFTFGLAIGVRSTRRQGPAFSSENRIEREQTTPGRRGARGFFALSVRKTRTHPNPPCSKPKTSESWIRPC